MAELYRVYVGNSLSYTGVSYWIDAGVQEQIGDREFVRYGRSLTEGRQGWHDTKAAALEDVAAQIDAIAHRLWAQATAVREKANEERAKAAAPQGAGT